MTTKLEDYFGLAGRVAIVTGGAMGIGAGIAEVLAAAGAKVVIADRDGEAAATRAAELGERGGHAGAAVIDIADEASVAAGMAAIVAEHGAPWVLVNNAGVQDRQLLLETDGAEWDRTQSINARGTFFMLREAAKAMIAAGAGGRIVNVASLVVLHPGIYGLAAYASSKGAVAALTRNAAFELAQHAITVNAVLPGGVITPGGTNAKGPAPEGPAMRGAPLGLSEPQDMGGAVLYLASPIARHVTGQSLAVDAGFLLS